MTSESAVEEIVPSFMEEDVGRSDFVVVVSGRGIGIEYGVSMFNPCHSAVVGMCHADCIWFVPFPRRVVHS